MWPEQRSCFAAALRTFPLLFAVFLVALAICLALDTGPLIFAVIGGALVMGLAWWRTREEYKTMKAAADERRAQRASLRKNG